jgi:hypothetical protein
MAREMTDEVRDEITKQCIILLFGIITLVIFTIGQRKMTDPDFLPDTARKLMLIPPKARDAEAEAMTQVQREISWMEHADGC